jgi:hypothetical protein
MKTGSILLWCMLASAACAHGAEAGMTPTRSERDFQRLAHSMANLPARGTGFPDDAVIAVQLAVTQQIAGGPQERRDLYLAWRSGHALRSGQDDIPAAALQALNGQLSGATPSAGLLACGEADADAPSAPYIEAEVTVLLEGRRPLRLRSDPTCNAVSPWHVTDGIRLYTMDTPAAANSVMALAQALCGGCLSGLSIPASLRYAPAAATTTNNSFTQLYASLIDNWNRLGRDQAGRAILQRTLPLSEALDWIDHARFRRMLAATERRERGTAPILAHELLRPLLPYPVPSCGQERRRADKYNSCPH